MTSFETQEQFITHYLHNFNIQTHKTSHKTPVNISDIFSQLHQTTSHGDLKYLALGIDILFQNICNKKQQGLYTYSKTLEKWLTNKSKLAIQSVEGNVYIYNISDTNIQIIIKRPKKRKFITTGIREFYIGYIILNKLRYYIPTFVYTLGGFWKKYHDNTILPHILYEKIDGLKISEISSFKDWLIIFLQLLLSLELAQREFRFTHFDLHTHNVIIKNSDKLVNYNIHLDNTTYGVQNTSLLPVIIDFGLSSVYSNGRSIGKTTLTMYGIFPYIIPGYDMYKFLCYSTKNLKHLQKELIPLFAFYKNNDPYNIRKTHIEGVKTATSEYCKMVTFSKAATYTPLLFFKWIYKNYPFLRDNFTQTPRKIYITKNLTTPLPNLFEESQDIFSYISIKYILTVYNDYKYNEIIKKRIEILENYLYYSDKLIEIDKKRLEKVFFLEFPKNFQKISKNILQIPQQDNNQTIVPDIAEIIEFSKTITSFMEIYYTILELNLDITFKSWVDKFIHSSIFHEYIKNIDNINMTIRWYYSLKSQ